MVALIALSLMVKDVTPPPPLIIQPETLPCSSAIVLKAGQPHLPKTITASIDRRALAVKADKQEIVIRLQGEDDCGKTLLVKAGGLSQTYRIDRAPLPRRSDSSKSFEAIQNKQAALTIAIQSVKESLLLAGGIVAILVLCSCAAFLWMTLNVSRLLAVLHKELRPPQVNETGSQEPKEIATRAEGAEEETAPMPAAIHQPIEPWEPSYSPPTYARVPSPEESLPCSPAKTVSAPSFMEIYAQLSSGQHVSTSDLPKTVIVNFRNPEALDKNPDQKEPLVRDNSGTLMVLEHDSLPKGEYYLAPSPEFQGQWSETHTRRWRSLFDFTAPKAMTMVQPAIVRSEGAEWQLVHKGTFS